MTAGRLGKEEAAEHVIRRLLLVPSGRLLRPGVRARFVARAVLRLLCAAAALGSGAAGVVADGGCGRLLGCCAQPWHLRAAGVLAAPAVAAFLERDCRDQERRDRV